MYYIGTSGYYYKNWVGDFYPPDLKSYAFFDYYAKKFNSLELNSTFYRTPKITTVKNWKYKLKSYKNFRLSVKANKSITHTSKFENLDKIKEFVYVVSHLDEYLGVILFQLPHSFSYDIEKLISFSEVLDKNLKYAIEFRNASWYRMETYALLKEKNISLVWNDFSHTKINYTKTADFIYIRLHGTKKIYTGHYSSDFLYDLKKRIDAETTDDVYVYFNNTDDNSAYKDALTFKEMIK